MNYIHLNVLKSPPYEEIGNVTKFASALVKDQLEVKTLDTHCRRTPDGILRSLKKRLPYSTTLDDPLAQIRYFTLASNGDETQGIFTMPIGLFGFSKQNRVCLPLLINSFWRYFLMIDKTSLAKLCGIKSEAKAKDCYEHLLYYRASLIEKIFLYYKSAIQDCNHVMAWRYRGVQGLTSLTAERTGYCRFIMGDIEVFSSEPPTLSFEAYLKKCLDRWNLRNDRITSFTQPNDPPSCHIALNHFLNEIFRGHMGIPN